MIGLVWWSNCKRGSGRRSGHVHATRTASSLLLFIFLHMPLVFLTLARMNASSALIQLPLLARFSAALPCLYPSFPALRVPGGRSHSVRMISASLSSFLLQHLREKNKIKIRFVEVFYSYSGSLDHHGNRVPTSCCSHLRANPGVWRRRRLGRSGSRMTRRQRRLWSGAALRVSNG